MKKYMTLILVLVLAVASFAQDAKQQEDRKERKADRRARHESKLEARKIGYITSELDLSSDEATKFWPIYNEMTEKLQAERERARSIIENEGDFTDAEAGNYLSEVFDREQKVLDIKRDYYKRLESAISKSKVARLHVIEGRFRDKVYESIKRKMKDRRKKGKRGDSDADF